MPRLKMFFPGQTQASILRPTGRDYCIYFFIRFKDGLTGKEAREQITAFNEHFSFKDDEEFQQLPTLASVQQWQTNQYKNEENDTKAQKGLLPVFTIGLSYAGYERLELPEVLIPQDPAFKEGLFERLEHLRIHYGDFDPKYKLYQKYYSGIHVCLRLHISEGADTSNVEALIEAVHKTDLYEKNRKGSFTEVGFIRPPKAGEEDWPGRIGALGFRDGIVRLNEPKDANGEYLDPENAAGVAIDPVSKVENHDEGDLYGSYMAVLKFDIDESKYEEFRTRIGKEVIGNANNPHLADALLMGRNKAGAVKLNAAAPSDTITKVKLEEGFSYSNDQAGTGCPFHAHIRAVNDRKKPTDRAPIIRRGYYYNGRAYGQAGYLNRGPIAGLLFTSFQSNLVSAFEGTMRQMAGIEPTAAGKRTGASNTHPHDAMLYSPTVGFLPLTYRVQQDDGTITERTIKKTADDAFINFRGGEYFFVPALITIQALNELPYFNSAANQGDDEVPPLI